MTRLAPLVVGALAISGCASSPSGDPASLDGIEFVVPRGWSKHDLSTQSRKIAEWQPPGDNDRKESITVITSTQPATAKLSSWQLRSLLERAQHSLSGGTFSQPAELRTRHGLAGFRLEGTFVPGGQAEPYHRIHATVVDGSSITHVLYTAKDPSPDHLELVVQSITRKGA